MEQTFSEKKIFEAKCYLCGNYYSLINKDSVDIIMCENVNCSFFQASKCYSFRPSIYINKENRYITDYFLPFKIEENWFIIDGCLRHINYRNCLIKTVDCVSLTMFDEQFVPKKTNIRKCFIPINILNIEEGIELVKNKLTNYIAFA